MQENTLLKERQEKVETGNTDIDLSQLLRNLSLTAEQRLVEHQMALELVMELEAAGIKLREKSK